MEGTGLVREHGTYACYSFGPEPGGDTSKGCRCDPCRAAVRDYERERRRRAEPAYVSATPAREHVAWLSTQGVGLKQVAKMAGVSHGSLWKLVYGKRHADGSQVPSKRIRPEAAAAILAVTPSAGAGGSRVPAGPVWADVQSLLARGWTKSKISAAIGQNGRGLQLGAELVTRRNAAAIRALLDQPVPTDVGRAWSAHHRAAAESVEPEDREQRLRDDARRAEATNRQRRYRDGEDYEPVPMDDIDVLFTEMAEVLEHRIDQAAWRHRRACKGKPAWMFFPSRGDTKTLQAAKAVCATCPVSAECLSANLAVPDGVFGGTSGKERRDLRREAAA